MVLRSRPGLLAFTAVLLPFVIISRNNIDPEACRRTHLIQIDLEDQRTIRLCKSRPSDMGRV